MAAGPLAAAIAAEPFRRARVDLGAPSLIIGRKYRGMPPRSLEGWATSGGQKQGRNMRDRFKPGALWPSASRDASSKLPRVS